MLTESSSVPRHNEGNQTPAVWAFGTLFLFGMVFDMCISCVYIYILYIIPFPKYYSLALSSALFWLRWILQPGMTSERQ